MNKALHYLKLIKLTTPIAIIIGSVIIGISIVIYGVITSGGNTSYSIFTGKNIDPKEYIEGDSDNDVIVMEYSDPECPYCVTVYPTIKQLRNEYKNKIAFVYRHFPLIQIHSHAFAESMAIACVKKIAGTKKSFEYIDALYGYKSANQTTELPSNGTLDLAKGVGIDSASFSSCIAKNETSQEINDSLLDGVSAGVDGTPTTFVLVKKRNSLQVVSTISGAQSYTYFKAAIEQALAE